MLDIPIFHYEKTKYYVQGCLLTIALITSIHYKNRSKQLIFLFVDFFNAELLHQMVNDPHQREKTIYKV